MRRRVRVVGSVCLSIKSHLTSGASVRPENTVVYSVGNGGKNICGVFFETAPFKSYGVKRKLKSQLLIRSSLLWLTRDPGIPVRCTAKHQRLLHEGVQAWILLR